MAVTYRELTLEQQISLAKQKSFEYEYNHFQAELEATALPGDTARADLVTHLDALVNEAQAQYDALLQQAANLGLSLSGELQVDLNNAIGSGKVTVPNG